MKKKPITYAFIDGQNLNLGVRNDVVNRRGKMVYKGQRLDYRRFRHYLREKYGVTRAYIFIGFMPTNNTLYTALQSAGFTLIFKTVALYTDDDGKEVPKGNVDTDIVLHAAAISLDRYDQAVFVSGDGDFLSLYQFMQDKGKLLRIVVPNRHRYSRLLNVFRDKLAFVSDVTYLLEEKAQKKTRSSGRITSLGQPGHGDVKIVAKNTQLVNKSRRPSEVKRTKA
jgi:uncharacterized LabA/DUF88 family protein